MAGQKKKPSPPVAAKPVHERGAEHQAEKLTGARAQRGMLPTGQPRFVYEVILQESSHPKTVTAV